MAAHDGSLKASGCGSLTRHRPCRWGDGRMNPNPVCQRELAVRLSLWRPRIKRILTAAVCASIAACLTAAVTVTAARPHGITQESIGGAKLGLSARTYKQLLGKPVLRLPLYRPSGQPSGWSRLVFPKRGLSVYFAPKKIRGAVITTWNRSYKTAAGLGPCSTITELKLAYGNQLKPSKFDTIHGVMYVYAYTLGKNLIFASNNQGYVEVVGLYNGSKSNVAKAGSSLSWARYITLSDRTCRRD
jgi:hypothetical protein